MSTLARSRSPNPGCWILVTQPPLDGSRSPTPGMDLGHHPLAGSRSSTPGWISISDPPPCLDVIRLGSCCLL